MGQMLIRRIPDDVHDALRKRARTRGMSAEALVRTMVTDAFAPLVPRTDAKGLGTLMAEIWQGSDTGGLVFERDRTPYEPPTFDWHDDEAEGGDVEPDPKPAKDG